MSNEEGCKFEKNTWPELARLAKDVPEAGIHFQGKFSKIYVAYSSTVYFVSVYCLCRTFSLLILLVAESESSIMPTRFYCIACQLEHIEGIMSFVLQCLLSNSVLSSCSHYNFSFEKMLLKIISFVFSSSASRSKPTTK